MVPMEKAQKMEGQIQLTSMKIERVDVKFTSASTVESLGEDNDAEKSLTPRTKRVPRRNTAVMKKKPLRHLPPMKEEVRKIRSRKVGQSLKRLLEGIDPIHELMISRQNSTLIQLKCDAFIASLGGGDCDVRPSFQQVRSIRRGQAVQQPWRGLCKTLEPSRFMGQTREFWSLLEELETYSRNVENVLSACT